MIELNWENISEDSFFSIMRSLNLETLKPNTYENDNYKSIETEYKLCDSDFPIIKSEMFHYTGENWKKHYFITLSTVFFRMMLNPKLTNFVMVLQRLTLAPQLL